MAITDEERLRRYRSVASGLLEYQRIFPRNRKPRWPLFLFYERDVRPLEVICCRAGFEWLRFLRKPCIWQTRTFGEKKWSAQIILVPSNPPCRRFEWLTSTDIWDMDAGHSASFGLAAHAAAHALRRRLVEGVTTPCMLDRALPFPEKP